MKKFFKTTLIIGLIALLALTIFIVIFLNKISQNISLEELDKYKLVNNYTNISVYDNNNNCLSKQSNKIPVSSLNDYTKNAFISIEDKEFYKHNGLNYKRIVKAVFNNLRAGNFKEGASTISQQLIKNTQLCNDKTIERKIKEMYMTQELEKEYSKDEILEMYLNNIYFGCSAYGIEDASHIFFNKNAKDLTIAESATLAGIIKSPLLYSPVYNYDNCITRRNLVLNEMFKDGHITQDQLTDAIDSELIISSDDNNTHKDNSYSDYDYISRAIYEASCILGLDKEIIKQEEYQIYTYLDQEIQNKCYSIINDEQYKVKNANDKECQGLITIVDNRTNNVIAYCGNSDYDMSNMLRQPGSAIKPIMVYSPAIQEGLVNIMTKINDEPIDIDGYKPNNVGNTFHGYVSIRDSVAYSYNIPAVKLMQELGIDTCKEWCQKFGIKLSDQDCGYALALGGFTDGTALDTLVNAYSVFANNGTYRNCTMIKEIKNKYGVTIYSDNRNTTKILDDDTAYLTTLTMRDGVKYGTSRRLNTLPYDIAGKTGTVAVSGTNNNTDAISIAYTTDYSVGCWLGNYTLDPTCNLDGSNNGGTYCTSVVKDIFANCLYSNSNTPAPFNIPSSVQELSINRIIYDRDNKVVLASPSIDERYTTKAYFSAKNMPETCLEEEYQPNLNIIQQDSKLTITFNTKPNYQYQMYCINNGKNELLLDTFSTEDQASQEYIYNCTSSGDYTFYIKYRSKEAKNYCITNKLKINYTQDISNDTQLLDSINGYCDDNYSWLFN